MIYLLDFIQIVLFEVPWKIYSFASSFWEFPLRSSCEIVIWKTSIRSQFDLLMTKEEKMLPARHYWFHIPYPDQINLHSFQLIILKRQLDCTKWIEKCIFTSSQFDWAHAFGRGAINKCTHGLRCTRTKANNTVENGFGLLLARTRKDHQWNEMKEKHNQN